MVVYIMNNETSCLINVFLESNKFGKIWKFLTNKKTTNQNRPLFFTRKHFFFRAEQNQIKYIHNLMISEIIEIFRTEKHTKCEKRPLFCQPPKDINEISVN